MTRLEELVQEMQTKYAVQAEFIVTDFSQGPHIFKIIEDGLEHKEIGILVNNVGMNGSKLFSKVKPFLKFGNSRNLSTVECYPEVLFRCENVG